MMGKLAGCVSNIAFVLSFPSFLFSPMGELELSDDERKNLTTSFIDLVWQSGFSKSFLVWRRRILYSASIFYSLGAVLRISDIQKQCGGFLSDGHNEVTGAYVSEAGQDIANYSGLGKVTLASQRVAPFCSLVVILIAAWFWTDYKRSRNILVPGWLMTLLLSLWPMMVPLKYLLHSSTLAERALLGATFAFGILPTYLSIIAGLTLGAKRVFVFAPSPLSGAMVVLSSVFFHHHALCCFGLDCTIAGKLPFDYGYHWFADWPGARRFLCWRLHGHIKHFSGIQRPHPEMPAAAPGGRSLPKCWLSSYSGMGHPDVDLGSQLH